jgi:hypothetical protein
MGGMQERITTTKKGSITSVQAVYVPADDCTCFLLGCPWIVVDVTSSQ